MSPHDDRTEPYFAGAEGELEQTEAPFPADYRDILVIGASAGGVEALRALVAELPPELPAAVFVVLHVMPTGRSVLASILDRAGALPVTAAEDGERHDRGHVYVAPPDRHLLLEDGLILLCAGQREIGQRQGSHPMLCIA